MASNEPRLREMKLFLLLAAIFTVSQAQDNQIGAPQPGTLVAPGENVTVQILGSIDDSMEGGSIEVSLVIGIVSCPTSGCPAPSADLGENLFVGKYEAQGSFPNDPFSTFENFTFLVPNDLSGPVASIQVQRSTLSTVPDHSFPNILYAGVEVMVNFPNVNFHPDGDNSKCIGILGGVYADGTPVDIFDCNGSNTQMWALTGPDQNAITAVNPADGSQWCLDAGDESAWANGVKMKIWQCFSNLPQQTWTPLLIHSGTIKLTTANFCLDLTNGNKTNQNVLQIWTCTPGDANQIWSVTVPL